MVEMVFVLPVLILLVFAIAKFGLMFNRWLTLSNAVHQGAREGAYYRFPCNPVDVEQKAKDAVKRYVTAVGIDFAQLTLDVRGVCGGSGSPFIVDAALPFDLSIPYAPDSLNEITLRYSSTMRNE